FRYYFLREIVPFEDGDITREKFKEAYNANLANGLGNLVSRIMKMSEQYLKSQISNLKSQKLPDNYKKLMENFELSKAMDLIWEKISKLDLRIQETQPFKLIKTDENKAKEILGELVSGLYQIAIMLQPFLPETSEKIIEAVKSNKMPQPLFLRQE
ncbi:class I tRNA ligase family protein, partial [Patescibacteria group bacterium]|nr:class I tRNA ligase family protein [Patescibacteria group bacterium]